MDFKLLFSPITVNSTVIPNRIAMPPMHLNYTPNGYITEQFTAFYRERVKGGVGLIVIGGCSINATAGGPMLVGLDDDKYIPGLKNFVETLKQQGPTVLIAQLYHAGRYAHPFLISQQPVAPSPIPSRLTKAQPKQLTIEEIQAIEDDFANAAKRAIEAGFDGVEILASAGYLISQFLSPLTNKRDDMYGGNLQNRMRFGLEVIEKVRNVIGIDKILSIRLGGSDFMENSNDSDTIKEVAKAFSKAGIDLFNVTGGWHETRVPQITSHQPHATFKYLAYGIKKATGKPTIISNRISTPQIAEQLLRYGWGDMVNFARPLIADPYLPLKAREGKTGFIRPCLSCNQMCFDRILQGKPSQCVVNPFAGKEEKLSEDSLKISDKQLNIAVIGGGIAGLTAAVYLAQKNHRVTIYEKGSKIGGKMDIVAAPHAKKDFKKIIEYYKTLLDNLNVSIKLNSKPTIEELKKSGFDYFIVATGSKPFIPDIDGINSVNVKNAEDVLRGEAVIGEKVVIIGGGAVGVDVANYIIDNSTLDGEQAKFLLEWNAEECQKVINLATQPIKKITVIEMLDDIGKDIGKSTRWAELLRLKRAGVEFMVNTTAKSIKENGVVVKTADSRELFIEADAVIIATGYKQENSIAEELKKEFPSKVFVIGDAKKPGKIENAIRDAFEVVLQL
ncbi:FAD-dependent oxidoreductase [Hippea jasoniae]|uniref:FAD-dependent oxidoreductase n=1 Tax=Hippea jasoniae TaxID=944479 RepID=UPI00055151BB|nr:FAD-dependent oxidoreductase [Hippea jasoniae]